MGSPVSPLSWASWMSMVELWAALLTQQPWPTIAIQDGVTMVSFVIVSLFIAIPIDKACDYIRKKLEDDPSLHSRIKLDIDDIVSLLNSVLSNDYFVYKDKIYKQIHGCAIGSPVGPVVANLCMEEIEDSTTNSTPIPSRYWKRYVDDSFCISKKERSIILSWHIELHRPSHFFHHWTRKQL